MSETNLKGRAPRVEGSEVSVNQHQLSVGQALVLGLGYKGEKISHDELHPSVTGDESSE